MINAQTAIIVNSSQTYALMLSLTALPQPFPFCKGEFSLFTFYLIRINLLAVMATYYTLSAFPKYLWTFDDMTEPTA